MQVKNHYWCGYASTLLSAVVRQHDLCCLCISPPNAAPCRILRHGRSLANEAAIIVSALENGTKPEYGLAEAGTQQAAAAGLLLQQQLAQHGVPVDAVRVYTSPFSRTIQTAQIAAEAAGVSQEHMQVTPLLRERYFGAPLELQSHENYCPAWEGDMLDATSKPAGNVDGESVAEVSARLQQLFQELEQQHDGQHILLVSHGDTLSVLQATFYGTPLTHHRQYGLGTAELKQLNSLGGSKQQQGQSVDKEALVAVVAIAATASS